MEKIFVVTIQKINEKPAVYYSKSVAEVSRFIELNSDAQVVVSTLEPLPVYE